MSQQCYLRGVSCFVHAYVHVMDRNIYQREGAYLSALCTALDQVNIFWQYNAVLFFFYDGDGGTDDDIVVRYFLFPTLIGLSSNFSHYRKGVYPVGIKLTILQNV